MTVLVIDIGSSSVRALLFSDDAQPIEGAVCSLSHRFTTSPPGAAVLDMREVQSRVETCIDTVLQHPAAAEIRVVGMATLVGNIMGVGAEGSVITPVYTYADTRSAEDVAALREAVDERSVHHLTGCMNHTAYLPSRLRWLRRTEPELFAQVVQWVDMGMYLYEQWLGGAATSYSVASWSGMLRRGALDWDNQWVRTLDIPRSMLAPLADYDQMLSGLKAEYARRWPALRDTPFCLAVGDGAAANVGSGCVDVSRIALTIGTTAALRVVSDDILPPVPYGLWGYHLDMSHHLIGGATSEGGNIFDWMRKTLAVHDLAEVEDELAGRAADRHGLTVLPLLAGERSPGWADDATGAVVGLRLSTTPVDIIQAALEAVAVRLTLIFEQIAPLAAPDAPVIGGGGALAASPAWAQMISSALGRPLHLTREPEITARGVAVLALHAVGACGLAAYPPAVAQIFEPRPAQAEALRAARDRQTDLYHKLITNRNEA